MVNNFELVRDWMRLAGQNPPDKFTCIDDLIFSKSVDKIEVILKLLELRGNLIHEESNEFITEMDNIIDTAYAKKLDIINRKNWHIDERPLTLSEIRVALEQDENEKEVSQYEEYLKSLNQFSYLIKEAIDLLVVTYGFFAHLGLNANVFFDLVMQNNSKKLESRQFREDGKIIVPDEIKKQLKEEIITKIEQTLKAQIELQQQQQQLDFLHDSCYT